MVTVRRLKLTFSKWKVPKFWKLSRLCSWVQGQIVWGEGFSQGYCKTSLHTGLSLRWAPHKVYFDSFRDIFNQNHVTKPIFMIYMFLFLRKEAEDYCPFRALLNLSWFLSLGKRRWAAGVPWSANNTPGVLLYPASFRFNTDQWKILFRGLKTIPQGCGKYKGSIQWRKTEMKKGHGVSSTFQSAAIWKIDFLWL